MANTYWMLFYVLYVKELIQSSLQPFEVVCVIL